MDIIKKILASSTKEKFFEVHQIIASKKFDKIDLDFFKDPGNNLTYQQIGLFIALLISLKMPLFSKKFCSIILQQITHGDTILPIFNSYYTRIIRQYMTIYNFFKFKFVNSDLIVLTKEDFKFINKFKKCIERQKVISSLSFLFPDLVANTIDIDKNFILNTKFAIIFTGQLRLLYKNIDFITSLTHYSTVIISCDSSESQADIDLCLSAGCLVTVVDSNFLKNCAHHRLFQWYKLQEGINTLLNFEQTHHLRHDIIIKSRTDIFADYNDIFSLTYKDLYNCLLISSDQLLIGLRENFIPLKGLFNAANFYWGNKNDTFYWPLIPYTSTSSIDSALPYDWNGFPKLCFTKQELDTITDEKSFINMLKCKQNIINTISCPDNYELICGWDLRNKRHENPNYHSEVWLMRYCNFMSIDIVAISDRIDYFTRTLLMNRKE